MKKLLSIICIFVLAFTLSSCKDKTLKMENGVVMTINDELRNVITMGTNAPYLTFDFIGTYNVYETSSLLGYIFTNNDNLKLSNDFYNHLKQFKDFKLTVKETYPIHNAHVGKGGISLDELNKQVSSKSMTLLKYISNMIENIDSKELISIEETQNQKIDNTNRFNILLTNAPLVHKELHEISMISEQNLKILRSICINIYGLSTLVINHQELYNDTFFTEHPSIYGIKAYQKSYYLEYAEKRKPDKIEEWLNTMVCKCIRLDGTKPICENIQTILEKMSVIKGALV